MEARLEQLTKTAIAFMLHVAFTAAQNCHILYSLGTQIAKKDIMVVLGE
jgi:hypothetical protein